MVSIGDSIGVSYNFRLELGFLLILEIVVVKVFLFWLW